MSGIEIIEGPIVEMVNERVKVRVDSTGAKTRKKVCQRGFKLSGDGRTCVKISAREKLNRSRGLKRSQIKRRSSKATTTRKRRKALAKRKQLGVKNR